MSFYELYERALEAKGMTTAEVCERTGYYPAFFSKLKSGHAKDVTWERALAIIDALGMTPDEFRALGAVDA